MLNVLVKLHYNIIWKKQIYLVKACSATIEKYGFGKKKQLIF